MKKTKFILLAILLSVFVLPSVHAQDSGIGLGIRATPDGGGFTGMFFLDRHWAVEAQLNDGGLYDGDAVTAVGMIEYHFNLPMPGWRLYFGGGIHLGTWNNYYYDYHYNYYYNYGYDDYRNRFIFGIDGIGGIEYMFKNIPLGLSGDFKPAVNFAPDVHFFDHNIVGASARYYFGARHPHHPAHKHVERY